MYPHRIRLRGPWEAEPLDPPGPVRRVMLPAPLVECGLGECRRMRFRRRFGRPRRIDEHERVWVVGEGLPGRATAHVNGHEAGRTEGAAVPFAFPVTGLIAERNELVIDLEAGDPDAGLWGDIALEVRCSAYLLGVRARTLDAERLQVEGQVGGEADAQLEVYVLAAGRTIGYRACAAGAAFEIVCQELSESPSEIRVELVSGAVIWYAVDINVQERPTK